MATEDSVKRSLNDLLFVEAARRKEQITQAQLRKLDDDRRQHEAAQREAHARQLAAEAAAREAAAKADAARRVELERTLMLERTRAELELKAHITLLETEQRQELERLAIVRDARIATLARQRVALLFALGAQLAVVVLMVVFAWLPKSRLQDQTLAQLNAIVDSERTGHARERAGLSARISELEATVATLRADRIATQHSAPVPQPERRPQRRPPTNTTHAATNDGRCVDPNDPLCGSLR
jgi:hypothetical protein